MVVAGYKINGYDATYERTNFIVQHGRNVEKNRVLEVTDVNSGVTFVFEYEDLKKSDRPERKVRTWRSKNKSCKV